MIKILNEFEIEEIKEKFLQRSKEVYISKATGYLITFTPNYVFDVFKNIERGHLIICNDKSKKQRISNMQKELKNFIYYDVAIAIVNLEQELKNFKYNQVKNHDEVNRGFKYMAYFANFFEKIITDKEMLMVDTNNMPTSFLLFKYKK